MAKLIFRIEAQSLRDLPLINKIKYLKQKRGNNNYLISVDGGINDETIKLVESDIAVVGSFITNGNYIENIKKLKESIYE